jgi:hypothetical protein
VCDRVGAEGTFGRGDAVYELDGEVPKSLRVEENKRDGRRRVEEY